MEDQKDIKKRKSGVKSVISKRGLIKTTEEGMKKFPLDFSEITTVDGDDILMVYDHVSSEVKKAKISSLPSGGGGGDYVEKTKTYTQGIERSIIDDVDESGGEFFIRYFDSVHNVGSDIFAELRLDDNFSQILQKVVSEQATPVTYSEAYVRIANSFMTIGCYNYIGDNGLGEIRITQGSIILRARVSAYGEEAKIEMDNSEILVWGNLYNNNYDIQPTRDGSYITKRYADAHYSGGGGGGLTEVEHDNTLSGKGTEEDPLKVVVTGDGLTAVAHDSTLSGDGTEEDPLKVIVSGGGLAEVEHDDTLTGKGTEDDPLCVKDDLYALEEVEADNYIGYIENKGDELVFTVAPVAGDPSGIEIGEDGVVILHNDDDARIRLYDDGIDILFDSDKGITISSTGVEIGGVLKASTAISSPSANDYITKAYADATYSGGGGGGTIYVEEPLDGEGTQEDPLFIDPDWYLRTVHTDDTLEGDGTQDDPLSVVDQGYLLEVEHNTDLLGKGTADDLLRINPAVMDFLDVVHHDTTLTGDGTEEDPLGITPEAMPKEIMDDIKWLKSEIKRLNSKIETLTAKKSRTIKNG